MRPFPLLNNFQHNFPLVPHPYRILAEQLGCCEQTVLDDIAALQQGGAISRVGVVFRPNRIGASTLAAMAVPIAQLNRIAQQINAYPEVNHNYQREHQYNLWFVVTAATQQRLQQVLHDITLQTGYTPLNLPMVQDFHIDLGFDLLHGTRNKAQRYDELPDAIALSETAQRALIAAIQPGFPLVTRPYQHIAEHAGLTEQQVLSGLSHWIQQGTIKRIGIVVRHHEVGYRANAMVVWDIPDQQVTQLGNTLGKSQGVTLCYQRPRHLPSWPYNLFTMIHGQHREQVLQHLAQLKQQHDLNNTPCAVLFSLRRFKQCGAFYR